MVKKKLFLVVNVDWFFLSHRLPIAVEAIKKGFNVTVFAIEEANKGEEIKNYGLEFIPLPASRSGTNIFQEFKVLFFLYYHYLRGKPDIVHHVAVKPVTYGSIAAKFARVPLVVNALSGLGFLFINAKENKFLNRVVTAIFKFGFKNPRIRFILQNEDDLQMIKELNVLEDDQVFLIRGSGVNLNDFYYCTPSKDEKLKIILPARMLWDKGVGEFVSSARILYPKYKDRVEFILVGIVDMENKAGIDESQLLKWNDEGIVKWVGFQKNMVEILKNAHIIVLPSYREGLPKSLIEACAVGRPIITTDAPGCREVVENGVNGFLVPVQNSNDLAEKIEQLILDEVLRERMGLAGRKKAEREFSIENVIEKTFAIYGENQIE